MKIYSFLSIAFILIISFNSCTNSKESDAPLIANDPSGDYSYVSNSKYFTDNNDNPITRTSDGLMYVTWNYESTNINITVNPSVGYSYYLTGTIKETHGDTTAFNIDYQIIYMNGTDYKITGNSDVDVPNIGTYDGYYIQDKKIVYSFKSTNTESYETTETKTEGIKKNY